MVATKNSERKRETKIKCAVVRKRTRKKERKKDQKNVCNTKRKNDESNKRKRKNIYMNTSWRQHPTRHQLYGHLPPITKTIQVRRTRHAGHCWRSRDELISDVLLWTPHMAGQKQDDQHEHTFSSYVRIRDIALKTYQR